MIDSSITNILLDTNATAKCYICETMPKEMNKDDITNKPVKQENFRFEISPLHCWIRSFECLLHIAYRLLLKIWQVRGTANKEIFENNKRRIQEKFKNKMGLIVDKPKSGFRSTNDGNTARRFFSNPELSAEITGVDKNFNTILRIIYSGRKINNDKFRILIDETRILYIKLYSWYNMPSSVHKILIHGCGIIDFFNLPIGMLSEEALEARHKEIRKHRLARTRKSSRINSNEDLINILFLTSDPFISSIRKISKISDNTNADVKEYLINSTSESHLSKNLSIPDIEFPTDSDSSDDVSDSD